MNACWGVVFDQVFSRAPVFCLLCYMVCSTNPACVILTHMQTTGSYSKDRQFIDQRGLKCRSAEKYINYRIQSGQRQTKTESLHNTLICRRNTAIQYNYKQPKEKIKTYYTRLKIQYIGLFIRAVVQTNGTANKPGNAKERFNYKLYITKLYLHAGNQV